VPRYVVTTQMMGDDAELDLPSNTDNIRTDTYMTLMQPTRVLGFQPHMHTRGKAMCLEVIYSGGGKRPGSKVETLNCVPNYKFNWMIAYDYAPDASSVGMCLCRRLSLAACCDSLIGSDSLFHSYTGQYNRGQDVVPVYEGWKPNADGTFTMYFGYFNRNYQEELDIPLGPDNSIDPGGDRGQPAHFYPRRHLFVFKVVVPKDWGFERRVIWTLDLRGKANTAKGWLKADWEIND